MYKELNKESLQLPAVLARYDKTAELIAEIVAHFISIYPQAMGAEYLIAEYVLQSMVQRSAVQVLPDKRRIANNRLLDLISLMATPLSTDTLVKLAKISHQVHKIE